MFRFRWARKTRCLRLSYSAKNRRLGTFARVSDPFAWIVDFHADCERLSHECSDFHADCERLSHECSDFHADCERLSHECSDFHADGGVTCMEMLISA